MGSDEGGDHLPCPLCGPFGLVAGSADVTVVSSCLGFSAPRKSGMGGQWKFLFNG